jgi:hypothetical protein
MENFITLDRQGEISTLGTLRFTLPQVFDGVCADGFFRSFIGVF